MIWTEERIERLKELWTEGLSAGQIAAELGGAMTRNAVISKAHRLGLAHGRANAPSTPRSRKPSPPPEPSETVEPPAQNDPSPAPMMLNQVPAAQPAALPLRKEAVVPMSEGDCTLAFRPR